MEEGKGECVPSASSCLLTMVGVVGLEALDSEGGTAL